MLRTRLKTAFVALPAVIALIVFAPAQLFSAAMVLLALWGLFEIGAMLKADRWQWLLIAIAGGIPAIAPLFYRGAVATGWLPCLIVFALMMVLVAQVGASGADSAPAGPLLAVLGAVWVGVLFPYFALLRNLGDGIRLTILMLLLVVACDTGAYLVGRSLGKIRLLPRVSPNKTVEGAAGGLAGAVIAAIVLRPFLASGWPLASAALLAIGVGILAQAGDLANSAFKRVAGVKDSGWIFPGHGGLLDRTCSLVFPAVLTYYYLH
ncbi:MAG TPA: phosphatidate cytidylyltransferase [Candidatus Binataceae bacterium]|nr:phosphatidate cytidylyltransferase [Candidatus Binataceae bacterium]